MEHNRQLRYHRTLHMAKPQGAVWWMEEFRLTRPAITGGYLTGSDVAQSDKYLLAS